MTPAMIGVITMLAEHPAISQARLARLIGLERATIGSTVGRAIEAGLVVRTDAHGDARSYALSLSPQDERMLRTLRRLRSAAATTPVRRRSSRPRRFIAAALSDASGSSNAVGIYITIMAMVSRVSVLGLKETGSPS